MKQMGKKIIREEVCFVPARLYKKRYISYTYACDCHDESIEAKPIRCAETPKAPIQRSFAGASVLAGGSFSSKICLKFTVLSPGKRVDKIWITCE